MSEKYIPFSLPDIGEGEINEVVDTLRSGWITTGPKTKQFENKFCEYLALDDIESIAVNSATAGLHLALEAFGIGPGDEVITTTLTFTATAEVVRYLGADVRLVDIEPDTMNMDIADLEKAISQKTKAIIPVHYAGHSCDMNEILKLAKQYQLVVIEDAAHALPTEYQNTLIGTLDSDATVFSFYANKTMTTGEGGVVVTRNQNAAKRMKNMRLHGIDRDAFDRFSSKKPAWYYEVIAPGYKYNMTDIAASIGLHQLARLDTFWQRRNELAKRYLIQLRDLPLILPIVKQGYSHSWHLFVIRLNKDATFPRDTVIQILSEKGIGTSVHYVPLHRQPYWQQRYQLGQDMFPIADEAYQSMISIPLYTTMTDDDQTRVIEALYEILG